MTTGILANAGERLGIDCAVGWVGTLLEEASDGGLVAGDPASGTLLIRVEAARDPFDTAGWEPVARGVHGRRPGSDPGSLVLRNLLSTGFDLRVDLDPEGAAPRFRFTYRWRPGRRERAVALALRSRFHLLARSALLRYPALWVACSGKSTLVAKELAAGGSAISDNGCVSDGACAWGVVEPLRVEGGSGRRMQHGRREARMPGRVPSLTPHRIVVLRRGTTGSASVRPCDPEEAARSLVTGTYMAQELRRYWAFAATLALGTGVGPAHPPVAEVAAALARDLPATLITLPNKPGPRLAELLEEAKTWT